MLTVQIGLHFVSLEKWSICLFLGSRFRVAINSGIEVFITVMTVSAPLLYNVYGMWG